MPNLPEKGHSTRVYDNQVFENNTKNFGHAGTPVASVPAGSGILVTSNDKVEIFNNKIRDNKTANVIISSVYSTGFSDMDSQSGFDPYPESIYIYGNEFSGGGNSPDGMDLKAIKAALYGLNGSFPDILWDGYIDENKFVDGKMPDALRICINNGNAKMASADGSNGNKNPAKDTGQYKCDLPKLTPVKMDLAN